VTANSSPRGGDPLSTPRRGASSANTSYLLFENDVRLAARIHRATDDLLDRQPAVLVTGSWLTVKEQMADHYARALAERGYTAITFDFAGFGQSGGDPRQAEIPARKIADIAAAARQVSSMSFVRPGPVGYLAICASAQYALAAIAGGAPIASFASVAGWYHDTASVAPFYGGAEGVALRIDRARSALAEYLSTGEVRTVPAYENGNDRAGMFFELDYYASPGRGAVPAWTNAMAEFSWLYWLTFDGLSAAPGVSAPALFVHSDDCVLPGNVKAVRDRLTGPSELVWARGSQTDFYDQPDQVSLAVDAADRHFRRTLA
jgi:uncharacterized protein